jgi:hypothetical protein
MVSARVISLSGSGLPLAMSTAASRASGAAISAATFLARVASRRPD